MNSRTESVVSAAIVGLGRAGWHLHLHPMLKHGGFRIVGGTDPVPARIEEMQQACGACPYPSLERLLDSCEAELVVVATPSFQHFADAKMVLESGRHCILEKPMALCFEEAEELVEVARENSRRLFVHHTLLHRPEYHHLASVLRSGVLGPVFHLRAFWGSYDRRNDWQTLKKNGGGQLNNTCPHVLSVMLPLLGSPVTEVFADLRSVKDAGDAEDHVHMVLAAESGVTADIVVSTAVAFQAPKWMLFGKYGGLTSDGVTSSLKYYDPAGVPEIRAEDGPAPGRKYRSEELPWVTRELKVDDEPARPFHEDVHRVLTRGDSPLVTPESALEVVRVSEMAARSFERRSATDALLAL